MLISIVCSVVELMLVFLLHPTFSQTFCWQYYKSYYNSLRQVFQVFQWQIFVTCLYPNDFSHKPINATEYLCIVSFILALPDLVATENNDIATSYVGNNITKNEYDTCISHCFDIFYYWKYWQVLHIKNVLRLNFEKSCYTLNEPWANINHHKNLLSVFSSTSSDPCGTLIKSPWIKCKECTEYEKWF